MTDVVLSPNQPKGNPVFCLLIDDPGPVFAWLEQHAGDAVIRKIARDTTLGWSMKVVLDDPAVAAAFEVRWKDVFETRERVAQARDAFRERCLKAQRRRAAEAGVMPTEVQARRSIRAHLEARGLFVSR